jgi:Mg2+ and Co2+ transporter CorA
LFGEGEIHTVGDKCRQEPPRQAGPIYNDAEPDKAEPPRAGGGQDFNTAEIISKTIEILESKTVFTTAIVSNIEAFHEAIQVKHEMQKFKAEMQTETARMIKDIHKEVAQLRNENKQLRDEIQRDRDQSVAEDTG